MILESRQQIIAGLLDSPQLAMLLQEQVRKALLVEQSQRNYEHCLQSEQLVLDLEDTLGSVIDMSVRRAINAQFESLLDQNTRFRRDFEELKEKVLRLSIRASQQQMQQFKPRSSRLQCWSSVRMCNTQNSFQQQLDDNMFVELRDTRQPITLKRIQSQIDGIKQQLARISNNSLLQVVENNKYILALLSSQINRKIEDNYLKLSSVIQKNLQRNTEIELEKSIHSVLDIL